MAFTSSSATFQENGTLPQGQLDDGMGQSGGNRSLALGWTDPPEGTGSFAVTLHARAAEALAVDPDMGAAMVGFMINGARLGSATLTAVHGHGV